MIFVLLVKTTFHLFPLQIIAVLRHPPPTPPAAAGGENNIESATVPLLREGRIILSRQNVPLLREGRIILSRQNGLEKKGLKRAVLGPAELPVPPFGVM